MISDNPAADIVILISAHSEWRAAKSHFNDPGMERTPFGECFYTSIAAVPCVLMRGGWGKVSAAGSTQFAIDHWHPRLLINLGTCGGFEGDICVGEVVLANETVIYDIYERMGDQQAAQEHYTTCLDLSYLRPPYPHSVRVSRLVSADQDIDPAMVETLVNEYHAIAADWESGAIAWTAARNGTRLLILRVVSDLVNRSGGELYPPGDFSTRAAEVMQPLLAALPAWIRCAFPDKT